MWGLSLRATTIPENLIRHPFKSDTFAFLLNVSHLRYLHGISEDIYLGDSRSLQIQSIGQGVCVKTFTSVVKRLHDFLSAKMFGVCIYKSSETELLRGIMSLVKPFEEMEQEQYCFGF